MKECLRFRKLIKEVSRKLRAKTGFIRALSSTKCVAESSTMEAVRMSYCESVAFYGASAFTVHAFDTHIKTVETERNTAARASSGCLHATEILKQRALTGMYSLR